MTSFMHKSIQEYFVAQHINHQLFELNFDSNVCASVPSPVDFPKAVPSDPLHIPTSRSDPLIASAQKLNNPLKANKTPILDRKSSELRLSLESETATIDHLDIGRRVFTTADRNIVQFCADLVDKRVQMYITFGDEFDLYTTRRFREKKHVAVPSEVYLFRINNWAHLQPSGRALWDIVQGSRSEKARDSVFSALSRAAMNALMILTAANMVFSNCDFSYATLSDALSEKTDDTPKGLNLSGGLFYNCNFRNAVLTNCRLNDSCFQRCQLQNVNLSNAQLGQLPLLLGHAAGILAISVNRCLPAAC